ncbi:hypothetical protein SAMN00120144_0118 [Hymenobacter roseosalivarius DSM 11622]|uniref:DUF2281 domain-containing protein n=1 Tax=Hymenobacter roseosalivarius DSM 11622 TaxID=645990 RepID=A0A1W1W196_9BACT|nr:DUF2281 domain-containing protein [Hymenobacter roseosalivarius]SMB99293.1 hypothetical protein SAMN00120144_0118 [Hymenobacter roseosalivarius DSM 11622]
MTHAQHILQTLETLPADLQQEVAYFVDFLAQRQRKATAPPATAEQIAAARKAGFGRFKGQFTVPDDFDEPLEDFKDYI